MDVFDAILNRRSIRKFKQDKVGDDIVEKLLVAAMYAPTANNYQPWQIIVINDRKILDKIPDVHPYSRMLLTAPLAFVICGDMNYEKIDGYNAVNCAAATQNLLLAAHGFGLGTCWMGVYPREQRVNDIRKLFLIPEHVLPISLIAAGYPDEVKVRPERFIPSRVHYNSW